MHHFVKIETILVEMNILFLYDYMGELGGVQRKISTLSTEFIARGHNVSLMSGINSPFKYDYHGVAYFYERARISKLNKFKAKFSIAKRKEKRKLERYFVEVFAPQDLIIDFRSQGHSADFIRELIVKKGMGAKTAVACCNAVIEKYLGQNYKKSASYLQHMKSIICLTPAMAEQIHLSYGLDNCATIWNSVDKKEIDRCLKEGLPPNLPDKYILASARLHPVKGFDLLINAYCNSDAANFGLKLVILGSGEEQPRLENTCKELGIEKNVIFEGFVKNPFVYAHNALFFVLSSRQDGWGNVLTEYLYCGLPVISYDVHSGPSYIIEDQVNGLLAPVCNRDELRDYYKNNIVRPQDINSMKVAINSLVNDEKLLSKLKQNTRKSVEEKHDIKTIADAWESIVK